MVPTFKTLPSMTRERCVRFRFRYSACTRCTDECPADALSLSDEGIELDAGRCSGCGLCHISCPTAVFHLAVLARPELVKPAGRELTVSCAPSGEDGDVTVPCLGDLDLPLAASLSHRGVALTLRGGGHCEECTTAPAGERRLAALAGALAELGEAARAARARWQDPELDAGAGGRGHRSERRQLFRRWAHRAQESARREDMPMEAPPASAIRAAAHSVPARRRLADVLLGRLSPADLSGTTALLLGLGDVEADAGCTGCDACARVCPTGALKSFETDDRWRLTFTAEQCVGCAVCTEACGPGVLSLHPRNGRSRSLAELARHLCQGCGRRFVGALNEGCPVCEDDEQSFFAIFG